MASDAAEEGGIGTGGYLYLLGDSDGWHSRARSAGRFPVAFEGYWQQRDVYIAQYELSIVLVAVLCEDSKLRNRRGIWFIDNIAALMALVRGTSNNPDLNMLAAMIHAALFALQVWVYFEWVESEANWADGVSREGRNCQWSKDHGFAVQGIVFTHRVLMLPVYPMMRLAQFL